jgi:hypothetical protein
MEVTRMGVGSPPIGRMFAALLAIFRIERRPSGDTFAQRWPTLNNDAKRVLMTDLGIKVYARRELDGFVTLVVEPGELLDTICKIGQT